VRDVYIKALFGNGEGFIVYALNLDGFRSIANTSERGILLKTITAALQILRSVVFGV
jgi:hypothetical protein